MGHLRSLTIVIPAFNEEQRLPATLLDIVSFLETRPLDCVEILVVDDGSTDGTAAVARAAAAADIRVRLLQNPGNRGKGYSVRHGMKEARGEWVLFTDADLSAPIEDLGRLEEAVQRESADGAIGSRAIDRSLVLKHQSPLREFAGRVFNLLMRLITGLPYRDTQCGFKLFRHDVAQCIASRQLLEGFGFDVEILHIAKRCGYKIVEVPVRWANVEGTKVSLRKGLAAFLDPFRVRWNDLRGRYRNPRA
ncbi:MAG: dolichyl-phosphate beta-glucosyltransferase [Bryobacteraceae bacterium]